MRDFMLSEACCCACVLCLLMAQIRQTANARALVTNANATDDMHSSHTRSILNRTTSQFLMEEKPAQRDSSVMVLYLTETVAVPSADAEVSAQRPPDVYVAVVDDTLHDEEPTTMYVTAYYGDGSDKDTLVVVVTPQYHEGTWKRPFSPMRRYVNPQRASYSVSSGQPLERSFHGDSGSAEISHISSRTEAPLYRNRRLRRRKVPNPYIQFQPSYGHDTRTFVHLASGRLDIAEVSTFLDNAEPQGVISVRSVLEIPHAFRKWRYPNYAPVWDPDFLVTGDYGSSPLAPWYNATGLDALGWSYGIAEGIYQQRYQ